MCTWKLIFAGSCISLFSGTLGGVLSYEFLRGRILNKLSVHELEITDGNGQVRSRLGTDDNGGGYLRFLTPHKETVLLLGSQGGTEFHGEPLVELSDTNGNRAIGMGTYKNGNGVIAFDSERRLNTMLVGYYPVDEDVIPPDGLSYIWGVNIKLEHRSTGLGIIDNGKFPEEYVVPQSSRR